MSANTRATASDGPHRSTGSQSAEKIWKQATKTSVISNKLEWRIEKFERLMKLFKNGQSLVSKQFSSHQAPFVSWELHVYPNGKRDEDIGHVSFFLRQVGLQVDLDPLITEFQIYAMNDANLRVSICRDIKDFTHQQGRGKFQVQRDKLMNVLHADGSILLRCDLEFLHPGSKIDIDDQAEDNVKLHEVSVSASNREILENELFSDCKIQVGAKQFSAHRCMLGQSSQVFRSMFSQTATVEAQKGKVDIIDARPEAVRAMLEFVYTGTVDDPLMEEFAQDIIAIADKYAIIPLKERCELYLAENITNENIAEIAVIADAYLAPILKKACTRYIAANHRDISHNSRSWQALKRNRSEFVNDLLETVLNDVAFVSNGLDGAFNSTDALEAKKRRL